MSTVAIIGGGIAGLSAAYYLRTATPSTNIVLIESNPYLGGKIRTERIGEAVFDGGADSIVTAKPAAIRLCQELGITDQLQDMRAGGISVLRDGVLYSVPLGGGGVIPLDLAAIANSGLLSENGLAEIEFDFTVRPGPHVDEESASDFLRRHFGIEYSLYVAEPLLSSFYAADASQLSIDALFPQFRRLECLYGSLIKGAREEAGEQIKAKGTQKVSFRYGMSTLVDRLVDELDGVDLRTGTAAVSVYAQSVGYRVALEDGGRLDVDAVIIATPAYVTSSLLASLDTNIAVQHAAIPYASLAVVNLLYREQDISPGPYGIGYLTPNTGSSELLACMWTSRIWEERAPEGLAQIRCFIGRHGEDVLRYSEDQILHTVRKELSSTLDIHATPLAHRIFRWPLALPQYTLGHSDRVVAIEKASSGYPGLFLSGAAYRGIGIPDCVASGERAARSCGDYLKNEGNAERIDWNDRRPSTRFAR